MGQNAASVFSVPKADAGSGVVPPILLAQNSVADMNTFSLKCAAKPLLCTAIPLGTASGSLGPLIGRSGTLPLHVPS